MKKSLFICTDIIMKCMLLLLVGTTGLLLTACTEKETPGGTKYTIIRKGDGKEPEYGKYLVMNMSLKDSKDSIWFESKVAGYPVIIPVQDESMVKDEGEYGVFKALTKGDSVTFKIPARILFLKTRKRAVPDNIDPLSLFQFNVGVQDVFTQEEANAFQEKLMIDNEKKRAKNDSVTIANYLNEKGIKAISTPSGLFYVVQKEGTGNYVTTGQTAYVHYAGYLLNGKIFDTSLASVAKENSFNNGGRNEPYPVVVNTGGVIRGWDEMLQLMNKGMKVSVYIPSALAYGSQNRGSDIPANSILVFDMEVVDIK